MKEQVAKMKRFRIIGLALLAVFALGAVMSSAAQAETAPFFTINGTRLAAGKTHNFASRAKPGGAGFTLTSPALNASITCTKFSTEKGVLLGSNAGLPGKDDQISTFSGCTTTGFGTGCTVNEPIKTNPLTSELVEIDGTKEPLGEEFKPTSGTIFVVLKFTGANCLTPEAAVEGSVAAEVLLDNAGEGNIELGQKPEEATSWLVKFPATAITKVLLINASGVKETVTLAPLEFDKLATELAGTALVLLANTKFEPENTLWSPLP